MHAVHDHYQAHATYVPVDQLALSRDAARAVEYRRALREQKLARKAQRRHQRALRHSQEAYTTAV